MKTCIIFGAGAETSYGLSSGKEFAKNVVGIGTEKIDDAIKEFYCGIEKDEWYPKYSDSKWSEKDLLKAAQKKKWIDEGHKVTTKKDFEQELDDAILVLNSKEKSDLLSMYTSYMGLMESRFHTFIFPKALGPSKFWSIITCYWRAYLLLASKMLDTEDYVSIIKNPIASYDRMKEFAKKKKITADFGSYNTYSTYTYYDIVASYNRYIEEHQLDDEIHIVTTNYTPLCECICELEKTNSVSYLHGRFDWFEKPKNMKIVDVDMGMDSFGCDYFPYIFLQSGIKPIIEIRQLNEYCKAIGNISESERLIIVGYRANCDDNHLNSIIREEIEKGKKVFYFNFNGELSDDDIHKRLWIDRHLDNMKIINVDCSNCEYEFYKCLKGDINGNL